MSEGTAFGFTGTETQVARPTWLTTRPWLGRYCRTLGTALAWAAIFVLGDAALVLALPRLGLSFGPTLTPWELMLAGRVLLLGVSAGAWLVWAQNAGRMVKLWVVVNALIWAAEFYGFYLEPFNLAVTHQALDWPQLKTAAPLRMVLLSDLHVERITARERAMLAQVEQLQPDLIFLTGDYLNVAYVGDATTQRETRELLGKLRARYGIYAISGSVDMPQTMHALFDGLENVTVLDDQVRAVNVGGAKPLYLLGVADSHSSAEAAQVLQALQSQVPEGAPTVLLNHTPDLIETAARLRLNLYVAGHTHGGQIRLPGYGALITFSDYGKRYEAGYYRVEATNLYVSRGLGMEGAGHAPRVRFLCSPEIVVLENF
jgi:predicted MPP superfamily phosphohydrolase